MRRQQLVRCWATGLALATLAGSPTTASACGACVCETSEPRNIINLIRGVALNLHVPLPVIEPGEDPPELVRVSDGMPVPATVELDDAGSVWWLKVDEDLQPNTEYRTTGAQFMTGTARDAQAPTLGEVTATPGGNGALCDVQVGDQLTLSDANDAGDNFAVWLEVELDVAGTAQRLYLPYEFGPIGLGQSQMSCFGTRELSGIAAGQGYPGRVRLHDAAGNLSDWRSFVLDMAEEAPGGCGTPVVSAGAAGMPPMNPDPGTAAASGEAPNGTAAASSGSDAERTSKGCGCALGAEQRGAGTSAVTLALTLLLAARRRRAWAARNRSVSRP